MRKFLRKLKVIDSHTIELDIQKADFIRILKENIEEGSVGFLSGFGEAFKSSSKDFVGKVHFEGFELRMRRRLFSQRLDKAVAYGTFRNSGEKLKVDIEINSWRNQMYFYYGFVLIFYLVFVGFFTIAMTKDGGFTSFIAIPFLILHAFLMLGLPLIILRRSTSRMKRELEREFVYILNK